MAHRSSGLRGRLVILVILAIAPAAAGCGAPARPAPAHRPSAGADAPPAAADRTPAAGVGAADATAPILFGEATDTGIAFVHTDGSGAPLGK